MGKKDKNKKKGKGAEKTATKTDKKLILKQKKLLAKIGEADIEQIISQCEEQEQRLVQTVESTVPAPSPRVNFSICCHPDREELIIFGGELFDGQKTTLFNDLLFYNIPKNEWKMLKSPAGPTPRSGHQMVTVATDGGQLWLFGGEYASSSQIQFYHFKDLWVFRLNSKKWEKINAQGGPSARSGHRMVTLKKQLIVFGGFHDNNQSYRYFNDLYSFSLETYLWTKIDTGKSSPPPARSGCCMATFQDGKIYIWGGYSKSQQNKNAERGVTYSDMYSLSEDKNDSGKWKWSIIKAGGMRPPPRSGVAHAVAPNGKCYVFGGVLDIKEDEEDLEGQFSNDLHSFDLSNPVWRQIELTGKKDKATKKKRGPQDVEMVDEEVEEAKSVSTDGVFTMVVGPQSQSSGSSSQVKDKSSNVPVVRSHAGLVVCKGSLYVFGGSYEVGSKQFTLCDMSSLDLHKLQEWKTIIPNTITAKDWLGSDSESGSSDEDDDDDDDDDDSEDDDSDDDDSSGMDTD